MRLIPFARDGGGTVWLNAQAVAAVEGFHRSENKCSVSFVTGYTIVLAEPVDTVVEGLARLDENHPANNRKEAPDGG